jgi:hypothetical protein
LNHENEEKMTVLVIFTGRISTVISLIIEKNRLPWSQKAQFINVLCREKPLLQFRVISVELFHQISLKTNPSSETGKAQVSFFPRPGPKARERRRRTRNVYAIVAPKRIIIHLFSTGYSLK